VYKTLTDRLNSIAIYCDSISEKGAGKSTPRKTLEAMLSHSEISLIFNTESFPYLRARLLDRSVYTRFVVRLSAWPAIMSIFEWRWSEKLQVRQPELVWRIEVRPGEEVEKLAPHLAVSKESA
jgi:hypothetical protein